MDYLAIWQHFQSSSQRSWGKLWHSAWTPGVVLAGSTTLVLIYITVTVIYNLYLHPLSGFPGPFWARSSLLWRIYHSMGGRFHRAIDRQHKKYGHVVRVSPNELSFASVESWKAIYGHQVSGKPVPIKSQFYEIYGAGFTSLCIGSERDPKKHGRMRKLLSAAFATKSLVEQEAIVAQAINLFIDQLGRKGGPESRGLDLTKWYEMAAFDILGEMAFGESFNCIESGEPHFWSELVLDHLYFITLIDNLRRIPLLVWITRLLFPSNLAVRNRNSEYSRGQVAKRLSKPTARKDFLTTMVKHFEDGNLEKEELTAHVSTLVIAGGETIATFLGAVTYHLLQSQACHEKLKNEIRGHFAKSEDINATEARKLPYLQAVIEEGLRIYPPGSQGFPRVSTGMLIGSTWVPPGAEIYTSAWTVTHSEEYFSEPMKFKPDRWLDQGSTDVKEASQPFSLGPRGCLGQNFAMMEINLILAKTFWRYDLELLDPNLDWEGQSYMHVMWWKPELPVRFFERQA